MTTLIDSHAHIDAADFDSDRHEVLARARAAGVDGIICVGAAASLESAERTVHTAETTPGLWATVAVHPHDAAKLEEPWWPALEGLARRDAVVAVGETGLDYYYDHSPREVQREAFRRFLEMAHTVAKPVVCHIRDAHDDAKAILAEGRAGDVGGVVHCFTGTADDARDYVDLGLHISFSGIVTFKGAAYLREAVRAVPLDRILVETDAPWLAPVPYRGKRNEPAYVVETARVVAREAGVSFEDLAARTVATTRSLFALTAGGAEDIG